MSEKFSAGSNVRLYEGPAFHRVRPMVSPLVHGETYVVAETMVSTCSGGQEGQLVRVHLPNGCRSNWIEATWLCQA
ncbi:MAG: hypothetical protein LiPW15_143 [Parcubacteria group bacterium LiPW_15]|nr:MAG: hypothetical protein LiPW15_143 [Parcubacteria group bacterium LiPW_15]